MADENGGEARELANVGMYLTDGDGQVTDVWLPMTYHSHSLKVPLVFIKHSCGGVRGNAGQPSAILRFYDYDP